MEFGGKALSRLQIRNMFATLVLIDPGTGDELVDTSKDAKLLLRHTLRLAGCPKAPRKH